MDRLVTPLLSLFLALVITSANADTMRQIEVSGIGKVSQQPNMATTSFSFSQRAKQAAQGKSLVDTQVTNLLKLCEKLGIKESDIQAARLTIYPEYDYKRNRELLGYRVGREVQIKVRDLEQYPRLLDGAVGIGATHSGNLSFDFSNREPLENEAMLKAFDQAKQKAKLLAREADSKLGEVLWISESASTPMPPPIPMPMRAMKAEVADAAAYPTGEIEIQKHLVVRFQLRD